MAKSLHRQKVSITWAEKIDQKLASNVSNFITVVDIQQVEVFFQIELHELSMYSRVCANRPDKIWIITVFTNTYCANKSSTILRGYSAVWLVVGECYRCTFGLMYVSTSRHPTKQPTCGGLIERNIKQIADTRCILHTNCQQLDSGFKHQRATWHAIGHRYVDMSDCAICLKWKSTFTSAFIIWTRITHTWGFFTFSKG